MKNRTIGRDSLPLKNGTTAPPKAMSRKTHHKKTRPLEWTALCGQTLGKTRYLDTLIPRRLGILATASIHAIACPP
jgi:hypothetical protein